MNAKKELLDKIQVMHEHDGAKIVAAYISYDNPKLWGDNYDEDEETSIPHKLKQGHTDAEYEAFINGLDFDYNAGYGTQELYGIVWFTNGIWMDRYEYDGSEYWAIHKYPQIPEVLINEPLIRL